MQIFVKIRGIEEIISLKVNDTDTINVVKSKIQAKGGIRHDFNRLWGSGKWLKDDRTLLDYNIKEGSTLALTESWLEEIEIKIIVRTLTGKKIDLQISNFATVQCVKEMIQDREGIPPDQQRIIYLGQQLADDHLLIFYDICNDSLIHLILRLRGGQLRITVKYFKTLLIDFQMSPSVRQIKERIEELEGYPLALQKLTLYGRVLDDDSIYPAQELDLEIVTPPKQNSSCSVS